MLWGSVELSVSSKRCQRLWKFRWLLLWFYQKRDLSVGAKQFLVNYFWGAICYNHDQRRQIIMLACSFVVEVQGVVYCGVVWCALLMMVSMLLDNKPFETATDWLTSRCKAVYSQIELKKGTQMHWFDAPYFEFDGEKRLPIARSIVEQLQTW